MALKVGIQLYSVRDEMQENAVETIKKVAQTGYKYLEVANYNANTDFGVGFGVSEEEILSVLNPLGAKVISAHMFPFDEDNAKDVIDYHKAIGNKYIVCSMGFFKDEADVLSQCRKFNRIGEICFMNGMEFLYHNHFMEFQKFNGKTVIDMLIENTNPDYMGFELDTFWCMRAGQDPLEIINKLGARLKLVHQKDFSKTSPSKINIFDTIGYDAQIDMDMFFKIVVPEDFTEIGTGIMDIQSIIDAANAVGTVEYIILEQDMTQLGQLESIRVSMESFKKYSGIEWN